MWHLIGNEVSIHDTGWPKYDEKALQKDEVEIVIQINGKVREKLIVPTGLGPKELEDAALGADKVKNLVAGMNIVKIITVPNKLVNIVVR